MLEIRELIRRMQLGDPDRRIARDLEVSRQTVSKYRALAQQQGLASGALPDAATLQRLECASSWPRDRGADDFATRAGWGSVKTCATSGCRCTPQT